MGEWTEGDLIMAGYIIGIVSENIDKSKVDASPARIPKKFLLWLLN